MSELTVAEKPVPVSSSQAQLRGEWGEQLLDALPIGICLCDREGMLTRYNPRAAELWGRAPALAIERPRFGGASRIYWPDGRPMSPDEAPMAEVLRTGMPSEEREIVIERPDRTRIIALSTTRPLHSKTGELIGAVTCFQDITSRTLSEQRLQLLASEVDHRAKNMLAAIQAVIHLTQAGSVPEFKRAIDGRVSALSRAHTLLSSGQWVGADLRRIVQDELAPHSADEAMRVSADGPPLTLPPQVAQSLAMIVHELATNAARHGAIGQPQGRIDLRWWGAPGDRLLLRWTESGCVGVQPPSRKGFGIGIIEGTVRQQLGGTLEMDWRQDGLRCEIELPLS
jgi:two-component sensor histidine kinase